MNTRGGAKGCTCSPWLFEKKIKKIRNDKKKYIYFKPHLN